jgi:preprotein translocase subunit SecD
MTAPRAFLLPALLLALPGCGLLDALLEPDIPNPFQGEQPLEITLACEAGAAPQAVVLVEQRLEVLGLDAAVQAQPDGSIRVNVEAGAQAETLAALLVASPDLGFHAVIEDQAPLRPSHDPPEEAVLEAIPTPGQRPDMAFDIEAMQAMLALAGGPLPPVEGARITERFDDSEVYAAPEGADWTPWLATLRIPQGAGVVLECWRSLDEEQLCSPLLVESPAPITQANVASSELAWDDMSMEPHLVLSFDAQGKQAFLELSTRLVDRYLAIVGDGRVLSRPRVMEPIPGGQAWLTMGHRNGDESLLELWRHHVLLNTGPLPRGCVAAGPGD